MTLEERMLNGKLYDCADEKLQAQQRALNELVFDYNNTRPSDGQRRQELLRQIFQDRAATSSRRCTPTGAATPTWATTSTPTST